jgi:serine/threonine protein kinase/tetratricopeptide (TPR) repeat protein
MVRLQEVGAMTSNTNVDRNLLFAVIALQDDLIDQTQFADVCAGWAMRLDRPLSDLLLERKWITEADRSDVERKLERKLKKNQGDARATLGAVAEIEAREVLAAIKNPKVRHSIRALPPARGHVLVETLVPPPAQRDSLRYTLTRLHAEGGLGKIWIAHDTDLNRDVALKEIKSSTAPNPESWRRFLKEAQITGQLEHPNIVPVYELARRKEDDQPFYTMRFLRGQTLRDAIAEFHRRRGGRPAHRLELERQLLEPFVKVCQAVGYAHSRWVIHRDLKPENVVLGAHGEVVLLDWGLAKVVGQPDDEDSTAREPRISVSAEAQTKQTVGQVGTPAYMAPEQVEADNDSVGTRTDVYGLGAILFEILTAHPPVTGSSVGDVFSKIQAGNLSKAREIEPTVPRALEAICSKAMAHDPGNRYRRVEDLAEDVRRWIVDEPVSVHRDPLAVRVLRWGRRHRTLATTLAALLATAVIGLSIGVVLIGHERDRTETQRVIASNNATRALYNLRLAQDADDGLLGEVADVDLADIPQMEPVRARLLEKARAGYEQFLVQERDDPMVRWGAVRAQVRLGDIQALQGDAPKAEASYRAAGLELENLSKLDVSNTLVRRDLARDVQGLGVLLKDANRFQEGEAKLREAIRLREEIANERSTAEDKQALADSRYQLGALLARRGAATAEDLAAYRSALEVQEALVKEFGDRPEFRTKLVRYRNNLAILQRALGSLSESEATLRATLDLVRPSIESPDPLPAPRWQVARVSNNLGSLLLQKSRTHDEATTHLHRAQGLLRKLASEFPAVAQYPLELASVEYNLGMLAANTNHPDQAIAAYKESVRLLEPLRHHFPKSPAYRMKLALAEVALGNALRKTAPAEAEGSVRKALAEQSAVLAQYPGVPEYALEVGRGHYQLGLLLISLKPAEAVLEAEKASRLYKDVLSTRPDSELALAYVLDNQLLLANALIAAGRLTDAMAAAEQLPSFHPVEPRFYINAAALLIRCAQAAPDTKDGRRLAEDSLVRAVGVLRKAVQAKVISSKATLDLKDLAPLSGRDDFNRLRESLDDSVHIG